MLNLTFPIQVEGSLPETKLITYIQDYYEEVAIDTRPLVLICPGGGYVGTSNREGEALAMQFLAMGYHAAVLKYSCAPAVYPTALTELAASMLLIRQNVKEWHVNPDQIIVLGCSAGGHLAASLGVFWEEAFLAEALNIKSSELKLLRPDGMILCYPVITSGEFAHRGSFQNLLQDREEELSEKMSLELQVSPKTPPTFIWHTYTDGAVPVENSLLFVSALRKAGVSVEFHMYPEGGHGLSLANRLTCNRGGDAVQEECTSWISLVHTWMEHRFVK
ncbi:MAG: alpha/beta hydrolase [Lachnospiraceae bacterium]|nr:alpha/beta hydrolase [Lachnospiraceae bacterium]